VLPVAGVLAVGVVPTVTAGRTLAGVPAVAVPTVAAGPTIAGVPATSGPARDGMVSRVSESAAEDQANGGSGLQQTVPALSASGQVVAFTSTALNLVPGDTNGVEDVFVRDRVRGTVVRASVGAGGRQSDGGSVDASISADGRYVAFVSAATNLVRGDSNGVNDVFVRDLRAGTTRRVSVGSRGRQANGASLFPAMSADGTTVAFQTFASNLAGPGALPDTNGVEDVYVGDLSHRRTSRVSVGPDGRQLAGPSALPAISGDGRRVAFVAEYGGPNRFEVWVRDRRSHRTRLVSVRRDVAEDNSVGRPSMSASGRYVAFASSRSSLVPRDTNQARDVFVRDLATGCFRRVSVAARGRQADADSEGPSLSATGRFAAFVSFAENLVPGDTNDRSDVFLRDLRTGALERVSRADDGAPGNDHSAFFLESSVSANGRHVAFESVATNLVPSDTNRRPDVFVWDARR
jgi:Tol biopolymer transport system component